MPTAIKPAAISKARKLRREMTAGEQRLWSELREFRRLYGIHVRRQCPIGPYVTDFIIHASKLVIEVDGEHHFLPDRMERDRSRDEWFASQGYRTIRLNTGELSEAFDGCVFEILEALGLTREKAASPKERAVP
ncbi:MAG: endonuclease domain-containing protein [Rhizobiales bacterium]|nr:endonuclease domain-containing protein [Hyphomicrobiales bacterium]